MPTVPLRPTPHHELLSVVNFWVDAWHAKMRTMGYGRAVLAVTPGDGELVWTWTYDAADLTEKAHGERQDRAAWEDAHRAFLAVDHLRPSCCPPSPAIERFQSGEWTFNEQVAR